MREIYVINSTVELIVDFTTPIQTRVFDEHVELATLPHAIYVYVFMTFYHMSNYIKIKMTM